MRIRHLGFLALGLIVSCADGGEEDRPVNETPVDSNFRIVTLRTLPELGFPVAREKVFTGDLEINFATDGTYDFDPSPYSQRQDYFLDEDCALRIVYPGNRNAPSVYWSGAYSLNRPAGDPLVPQKADILFMDRSSYENSRSWGMFFGAQDDSTLQLEGNWHYFALHLLIAQESSPAVNDDVAIAVAPRNASDTLVIPAGANPTLVPFNLRESSDRTVTISGVSEDAAPRLELRYEGSHSTWLRDSGSRNGRITMVPGPDLVLGADLIESQGDRSAGLMAMMRKRDTTTSPLDPVELENKTFLVGAYLVSIDRRNPRSTSGLGTLELKPATPPATSRSFELELQYATGSPVTFTGTWTTETDGGFALVVDSLDPPQTWRGAFSIDLKSLVFLDASRNNTSADFDPVLGFHYGIRQLPPPPPPSLR